MELTIFMSNGTTFNFEGVTNMTFTLDYDEPSLRFTYVSQSTGKVKNAFFYTKELAGVSSDRIEWKLGED